MIRRLASGVLALALILSSRLPLPAPVRATAAVLALLLSWPLAAWPVVRLLFAGEAVAGPCRADRQRFIWTCCAWPLLGMFPLVFLALLGLLGLPLGLLLVLWAASVGLLLVLGWGITPPRRGVERPGVFWAVCLTLEVALLVFYVTSRGPPLGALDDAYDHLATIRHLVVSGRMEMPGAYYGRDTPAGLDPRKGVLHLGLAFAARLAQVDPLEIWRAAPAVMAALLAVVFLGLARALFERWWTVALAVPGLLLVSGDPGRLARGAYGGHWGLVVAWAGQALALAGSGGWVGCLAGFTAAGVHAFSPVQLMVPLLAYGVLARRAGPSAGAYWRFLGGAAAGALPIELARRFLAGSATNPLHVQALPLLLLPPGPIASPLEILKAWGIMGALAALLIAVVAFARPTDAVKFNLAGLGMSLALLVNPWLFGPIAAVSGSVANKLLVCFEPALAIPAILAAAAVMPKPAKRMSRVWGGLGVALILVGLTGSLRGRIEYLLAPRPESPPSSIEEATRLAARSLPPDAIVATDPMTSYALPALTDLRAIQSLQQHSPPGDGRALERLAVSAALYSTCVPLERALSAVIQEGATHLLWARPPAARIDQFGNHSDPRNAAALRERFDSEPDRLALVARDGEAALYRIVPDPSDRDAGSVPLVADGATSVGGPTTLEIGDKTVRLAFKGAPAGVWRRGEEVGLAVEWTRVGPVASYVEYEAHIRFESTGLHPRSGLARLLSKPLRRLYLEKRAGGSLRARAVELPFSGRCSAATWQVGRAYPDSLRFEVPRNLKPGAYRLRVALERGTLYPVLTPADLLRDEDRFSGPVLGPLEIR